MTMGIPMRTSMSIPTAQARLTPIPMNMSTTTASQPGFFVRHPWLFVCFAFALLCTAWSALIYVAIKQAPQAIEASAK